MNTHYKYTIRMAALALVGAAITACSSIDDEQTVQPAGKTVVLTGTLTKKADNNLTRALSDENSTPTSSWKAGERVAVYYQKADDTYATAEATIIETEEGEDGKNGNFTATLTDPVSGPVTLVYPATRHDGKGGFTTDGIEQQDGTIKSISDNWDVVTGEGTMTVEGNKATIDKVQMEAELSICRFLLKTASATSVNGEEPLKASQLTINVAEGENTTTYTVNRAEGSEPSDTFYVAMLPVDGAAISFSTTVGEKGYTKKTEDLVTLNKGTFYFNKVTMEEGDAAPATTAIDLSTASTDGRWTANCYMVHTAGDYKLPLVYGNAIKNGEPNPTAYTGVSGQLEKFLRHDGEPITDPWIKDNGITVTEAKLLWQDAEGLITAVDIDGDYLTLTVTKDATEQEGNAVVAAKDADGNTVWSWHIWVTKQTFAADDLTTVATGDHDYQVTPVNLGWVATSEDGKQGYCTYYQWGRKDPFKGTDGVTYDDKTDASIADNIQNPTTLYYVSNKPNNTTYYNFWDAQQTSTGNITGSIATATTKTVYDPCPAGFCVPTGNLYYYIGNTASSGSNWDDTNKGQTWTVNGANLYFPASGYRNYGNGSLNYVGSNGSYWSASAFNSDGGHYLYFSSGSWSWNFSRRAIGFPVRAVAEEE